jgi:thiol-disulfide isomerase/thioredoxin
MKQTLVLIATVGIALGVYLGWRRHQHAETTNAYDVSKHSGPAPDFSLADLAGQIHTLAQYRGKVVLLDFWATWCTPCRAEIPQFVEWQKKYGAQGFQVIGISMDDSIDPVRKFANDFQINYPILMGNEEVGEQYGGVFGLPVNLLIRQDGRILNRRAGPVNTTRLEHEIQTLLRR